MSNTGQSVQNVGLGGFVGWGGLKIASPSGFSVKYTAGPTSLDGQTHLGRIGEG